MEMRFYRCAICGKIVGIVRNTDAALVCCGQEMEELRPGTTDGALEKHVPVVHVNGTMVIVHIGAVPHPMTEAHHIEWVALQTRRGNQRKALKPDEPPEVCFRLCADDRVEAVYAMCNLHGLWKNDSV